MAQVEIRVDGLADLRRALSRLDPLDARNELRDGLKRAADIGAQDAKAKASVFSTRAANTIRATSAGNRALIIGGKSMLRWYGWADFGSRTPVSGQPRSVGPWTGSGKGPAKGRFIYPAIDAKERQIVEAIADAVFHAIKTSGF